MDNLKTFREFVEDNFDESVEKIFNSKDKDHQRNMLKHPRINENHLSKILQSNCDGDIKEAALKHPKINRYHISIIMNGDDKNLKNCAVKHDKFSVANLK